MREATGGGSPRTGGEAAARWQVCIDTGGTFTDCLARDPGGRLHRAKVLSSSSLRGTLVEALDPRRYRVAADWLAAGEVLRGLGFRLVGSPADGARVVQVEAAAGVLVLSAPPASRPAPGAGFELVSAEEAPVLATRLVTGTRLELPLPPLAMRLATTRGTNALLERRGQPPVLFVTRGFRDLLRIGTQQRPDLFALDIRRPEPLFGTVVEVPERLAADGAVLERLDTGALLPVASRLVAEGESSAAIALMHSYRDPRHERELARLLREAGFTHVACSAELAPAIRLLPRAETAVVEAYLAPVIAAYLERVRAALRGAGGEAPPGGSADLAGAVRSSTAAVGVGTEIAPGRLETSPPPATPARSGLHVMTSAGGLVRAEAYRAKDSLLSGPAGGVVGAARVGRSAGFERVIAFDMGGTSTDVARIDGDPEYVWEHAVGDAHLLSPALAIESVAAGGGSICAFDGHGLRVGPESAGARPGPACYGGGGPLTLTDVNLLLGRLDARRFGIPIDPEPAAAAVDALLEKLFRQRGEETAREPLLEGLLAIADERMADAIRGISLRKGYDPADYALVAFGGAGPQHACAVASRLGIRTVLVPPDAGLLSAFGLAHAVVERFAQRQVLRPLAEVEPRLAGWFDELARQASAAVAAEGIASREIEVRRRIVSLRYLGQEATLEIDWSAGRPLAAAFESRYREVYGHTPERRPVELESLRLIASSSAAAAERSPPPARFHAQPAGHSRAWWARPAEAGATVSGWRTVPTFERAELAVGASLSGPALVWERHSATVVQEGWDVVVGGSGALVLTAAPAREGGRRTRGDSAEEAPTGGAPLAGTGDANAGDGAVREELFIHRFEALVGEMGEQLRRTALSVNVRERLDFSCALLDPTGELVANAPHIPVHLGALGLCVREVARRLPLLPGDVAVTNHPAFGGSHLPDVTVIAPVHDAAGRLIGYVANRAHHAEIGGTRPGSMPPAARTLAEEGVVIPPTLLARSGEARWDDLRALLADAPHASRAVEENLADLRAQAAAVHRGAALLRALAAEHGSDVVIRYMRVLERRAGRRVGEALSRLPDGGYEAVERLDDGAPLSVRIVIHGDSASFDFDGSAGVHPGNLNATPAIVRSVVLYVLRLLVAEPLPLNEGLLEAVELRIPPGILDPPFPQDAAAAPAVVGGNVETSQRLVDTLLRALGLAACSQGTMNNVLFGNERFGYYETVCGGVGAGPGWHGADAVHTHMTNTRITDPEVLEHRYPVRLERFAIRCGSGGAGRWKGGDGAIRELVFLEPVSLSLLTQHRIERPFGAAGGEPGAAGRQRLLRAQGGVIELGSVEGCDAAAGDRLLLETPGGGGWGAA